MRYKPYLSPAISLLWFIAIGFFALDAFGSHATIAGRLGFSSTIFGLVIIAGFFWVRLVQSVNLLPSVARISLYLSALSLIAGLLIGILEYHTPDNHWYELTRINPAVLVTFTHLSFLIWVIDLPFKAATLLVKKMLYVAPLWLIGISAWVGLLPFDAFVAFTIEDGPIENLQVAMLVITAILTGKEALGSRLSRRRLFTFITLAFIVIALEEISWGQRLLGLETPAALINVNVQNETNIHNIGIINQLQYVGYIGLSGLGVFSLYLRRRFPQKSFLAPKIASWFLIIPLLFYSYFLISPTVFHWAEIIEILFYGGISIWILSHTQSLTYLNDV
jgi:hypothetical protein